MIVRRESTIIDYHAPFDQGFNLITWTFIVAHLFHIQLFRKRLSDKIHTTPRNWKKHQSPFILDFCLTKTRSGKLQDYRDTIFSSGPHEKWKLTFSNSYKGGKFFRLCRLCSEDSDLRKCAILSSNVAILCLLFKQAIIAPNKLIAGQHYKRLRRRIIIEFHT